MKIHRLVRQFMSLRMLLIVSFILMMAIAGFLGYFLTNIQAQKSMNELTELSMTDIAYGVVVLVQSQINIGHQLNLMESLYFLNRKLILTDWVVAFKIWRPITVNALFSVSDLYYGSGLMWEDHGLTVSAQLYRILLGNFNVSVCNDTVNFPGSNCSVSLLEAYFLDPSTFEPIWNRPIYTNVPYNLSDQEYWKTGVWARINSATWRSSPEDQFSLGYSAISPFYITNPPILTLNINAAVLDAEGRCIGMLFKALLLNFLSTHLKQMTASHKLLIADGRAFCFEVSNQLLTGTSHGLVYTLDQNVRMRRLTAKQSGDVLVAAAGESLRTFTPSGTPGTSKKVEFHSIGKEFVCLTEPLKDTYGLSWMVAVVVSLTDLFADVTKAAARMLIITVVTIVVLSLVASLAITFWVTRPLVRLSVEMEAVSLMELEATDPDHRSLFYEIATMQSFFHRMIDNLKEYRAFLPQAILNDRALENQPESPSQPPPEPHDAHGSPILKFFGRRGSAEPQHSPDNRIFSEESFVAGPSDLPPMPVVSAAALRNPSFQRARRASGLRGGGGSTGQSMWIGGGGGVGGSHADALGPSGSLVMSNTLQHRPISVLQMDVRSFHGLASQPDVMQWVHTSIAHVFAKAVQEHRGTCCPPIGDKMMALWNVRIHRTDHATLCVNSAIRAQQSLADLRTKNSSMFGFPDVAAACTSGPAMFGTMGTRSTRSFATISPCITRGAVFTKLAGLMPCKILCDCGIFQPARYSATYRLVAMVPVPCAEKLENVFEVVVPDMKASDAQADEWMYQIDQLEKEDQTRTRFHLGVSALFSKRDVDVARTHFTNHLEQHPDDGMARWLLNHAADVLALIDHPRRMEWGLLVPAKVPGSSVCCPFATANQPTSGSALAAGRGVGVNGDGAGTEEGHQSVSTEAQTHLGALSSCVRIESMPGS